MYGYNFSYANFQAFILRLMVDENYQGRGYGTFGLQKMLETFRNDDRIQSVAISYKPENEVSRKLYARFGFRETGEFLSGEVVAKLELRTAASEHPLDTVQNVVK